MAYQIISAYVLDIILGDPHWFPHPVKFIGRMIEWAENKLRQCKWNLKFTGVILALSIITFTFIITYFVIYVCGLAHFLLGIAVNCFFIYTSLSINSLSKESRKVYYLLKAKRLPEARESLSMIVGRDTKDLNESEIVRATIETVAENTVDGILAPLFYACIGGAPLALAYKAINTLDSMIGYKNEKYKELGWFSAKLDDAANWIPARLSVIFIPIAAFILRMSLKQSIKSIIKDSNKSPSPNAGIPEAGFAGALGIQLGGTNYYGGIAHERPVIGIGNRTKVKEDILKSINLMRIASLLLVIFAAILLISFKSVY